jgi:hypothetical protein
MKYINSINILFTTTLNLFIFQNAHAQPYDLPIQLGVVASIIEFIISEDNASSKKAIFKCYKDAYDEANSCSEKRKSKQDNENDLETIRFTSDLHCIFINKFSSQVKDKMMNISSETIIKTNNLNKKFPFNEDPFPICLIHPNELIEFNKLIRENISNESETETEA